MVLNTCPLTPRELQLQSESISEDAKRRCFFDDDEDDDMLSWQSAPSDEDTKQEPLPAKQTSSTYEPAARQKTEVQSLFMKSTQNQLDLEYEIYHFTG